MSISATVEDIQQQQDTTNCYETFNGFIVSHDSHYDPVDNYYHLDMNGETATGFNCTYPNYFFGGKMSWT